MPELPEVEGLRRFLSDKLTGRVITRIDLVAFAVLKTYQPAPDALYGLPISEVTRHGKWLDITAQGLHLIFHLSRAGWLRWADELSPKPPRAGKGPLMLRVSLDDGSGFDLTEAGTQRKLAVHITTDPHQVERIATLGPDPLAPEFSLADFSRILDAAGRQQIKGVLRDQGIIAGIGNAYSDEILHAARLSPYKLVSALSESERSRLFHCLQDILIEAVERSGGLAAADLKDAKRTSMRVHNRTGEPCAVCGSMIMEVAFASSTMQYCPGCQTGGKPLADRRLSRLLK